MKTISSLAGKLREKEKRDREKRVRERRESGGRGNGDEMVIVYIQVAWNNQPWCYLHKQSYFWCPRFKIPPNSWYSFFILSLSLFFFFVYFLWIGSTLLNAAHRLGAPYDNSIPGGNPGNFTSLPLFFPVPSSSFPFLPLLSF